MNVKFSTYLKQNLITFDDDCRQAVLEFVAHVKIHGLKNLKGRNKSSALPNPHTKKEQEKYQFSQKYCLWHYHLGVPSYVEQISGDFTSEMILHYIRYDEFIVLVDIAKHPPFNLPTVEKLEYGE